jgi:6-phosphogluconolactonase
MLPLLMTVAVAKPIEMYLGTYTAEGGSRGVYRATLDRALAAETENPSYLALDGDRLYAVEETDEGGVRAYRIGRDGGLTLLGRRTGLGAAPCHLSAAGDRLLVANYGAGSVATLPIERDGSLGEPVLTKNAGSGPVEGRQEGPHLHFVQPHGGRVYACDLGTDEILVHPFERGALGEPDRTKSHPGGGPRHLAFGKGFAYANHELDNTVTVFAIDAFGTLTAVQNLSALPEGFAGTSHGAEIALHPSGRWLYASNRGHDSVATFAVAKDGTLSLTEVRPVGVKEPRGFGIDPSGRWMVVAGQNSDALVSFPIDPKTGRLGAAAGRATVGKPVCVVFRD